MDEIKSLAEEYLGIPIPQEVFEDVVPQALRKLEWIIDREGDANGERLKPYYLAKLVEEAIRQEVMTIYCMQKFEDKKRAAHKNADNSNTHPHYSIPCMNLSRV